MHVIYCITTKPCYITITSHFTITLFALQLNIAPSHINVTTVRCYIKVSRIKFSQNPVCTWQNLQTSVVNMVIGLALQQAQVMYYSLLLKHFITYLTSFIFQQIRNNPNTRKNKIEKNNQKLRNWPLLVQFIFHLKLKEMEAKMNYCINTKKITSLVSHPLYDSRSMTWTHHFTLNWI